MNFIKLTLKDGKSTFVNMDLVYEVRAYQDKTVLFTVAPSEGGADTITVTESPEQILQMI